VWHVAARKNHLTVLGYHWPHVTGRQPKLLRRAVDFVGNCEESNEDGQVAPKVHLACGPLLHMAYTSLNPTSILVFGS